MKQSLFDKLISFLFGASWAVIVFGALITFKILSPLGFIIAFVAILIFLILSFLVVLILDAFAINRQKLQEMKKQTKLLEEIASK